MRIFRTLALACALGLAGAMVMPRSAFEHNGRNRNLADSGFKLDPANIVSTILDINEGGGPGLAKVLSALHAQTPTLSADEETFQSFFDTYFFMQQTPAYKNFLASQGDVTDATTRSTVLGDSITNAIDMVANLMGDSVPTKAGGLTGMETKLASFYNSADENVKELLERNAEGDKNATPTLQQLFFDKHYSGLDIESLKNDNWIEAQRYILSEDKLFNHYVDDSTKEVVMDAALKFGDNLGNVDTFYTGDRS